MKGYGKKLAALFAVAVLTCSTISTPLISIADNSETLIKKQSETNNMNMLEFDTTGDKPVIKAGAGVNCNLDLFIKRDGDTFQIMQIAYVDWVKATVNGQTVVNADIKWVDEITKWLLDNGYTKKDSNGNDVVMQPTDFGAVQAANNGDDKNVVELVKAMQKDDTLMDQLRSKYLAGFHNDPNDPIGKCSDPESVASADNPITYTNPADQTKTLPVIKVQSFAPVNEGRFYSLKGIQYGIYLAEATSKDTRIYQPLMIDMVPKQTGPTGNWYMPVKEAAHLKYEMININKSVNKGKNNYSTESNDSYDIVGAGEIVDFDIEIQIPKYPSKTEEGTNKVIYEQTLFNGYDIMEAGYELIPYSARITYVDADGNVLHPTAILKEDILGNLTATDLVGTQKKTYDAILGTEALTYYDTASGEDINIFSVQNGSYTNFFGVVDGRFLQIGPTLSEALTRYNTELTKRGKTPLPTNGSYAVRRVDDNDQSSDEIKRSFISCQWIYTDLMESLTYADESDDMKYKAPHQASDYMDGDNYMPFVPDTVYITYSALINDKSFLGTDKNINKVKVGFIADSGYDVEYMEDETEVWTYGVNIVKVDGATLGENGTPRMEADGITPVLDENGDQVYDPTYLEGALFDLYQLDTTYCGGESAKTAPSETDYANYHWLSEKDSSITSYAGSETSWSQLLERMVRYHFTTKNPLTAATTIPEALAELKPAILTTAAGPGWETADKFANKYETLFGYIDKDDRAKDASTIDNKDMVKYYFNSYTDKTAKVILLPVEVSECTAHPGVTHYHIQAYIRVRQNIESVAPDKGAEGITVNGLDVGTYLLVETKAPDGGYNMLSDAIQFEINPYTQAQATDGSKTSYKGFISDKKLDNPANHVDGDGYLQVGADYYLSYPEGVYPLTVQNFKGIKLPSTGGIGTLLFTIIGVAIMGSAFFVVLYKRRKAYQD